MSISEAITILTEHNKWKRGEPPYDDRVSDTFIKCPHTPNEICEAIDILVEWIISILNRKIMIVDKG